ncbi:hypothetical protein [Oceanicola sp. S124]|uniref:hypothetical protein n=1 Tax=Oceanicola sp. S124 TaxID=1042378 RepID=UPI000255A69F|nr:hypothetical protein [Oceanicola sp. S124]
MDDQLKAIRAFADEIQAGQDRFLTAVIALAQAGKVQIIPTAENLLGAGQRPVLCLPRSQYDRLLNLLAETRFGQDMQEGPADG